MAATAISSVILAAVLSTFLLLGRTGRNSADYSSMSSSLRTGLAPFTRDARLAADVRWHTDQSLTFTLRAPDGRDQQVTYGYEPDRPGSDSGVFFRETHEDGAVNRIVLVRDVASGFAFRRYRLAGGGQTDTPATNDLETKLVEVSLRTQRRGANGAPISQVALSTRSVLRNKTTGQ